MKIISPVGLLRRSMHLNSTSRYCLSFVYYESLDLFVYVLTSSHNSFFSCISESIHKSRKQKKHGNSIEKPNSLTVHHYRKFCVPTKRPTEWVLSHLVLWFTVRFKVFFFSFIYICFAFSFFGCFLSSSSSSSIVAVPYTPILFM